MLASAQDVEHACQLPSQSSELLGIPIEHASSFQFLSALLDEHVEHHEGCIPIASHSPLSAAASLVFHETQHYVSTRSCHAVHRCE